MLFEKLLVGLNINAGPVSNKYLYAWGQGYAGQVGDNNSGTGYNVSSPIQIGSLSWKQISAGSGFSAAVKSDGTLWTWGLNNSGQLGLNYNYVVTGVSSPVLINSSSSWKVISNGTSHAAAIRADGSLWVWGLNSSGQLGLGDTTLRSSPVQLGSSSWSVVSCGGSHSLAITTTGQLYGWGLNTSGQVGDGTIVSKSSPVLVSGPAATSWAFVAGSKATGAHSLAITSTGKLYAWGLNVAGQLGILGTLNQSFPVLVSGPAATSWSFIAAGQTNSGAITTNGALYTWGDNTNGRLGDGTIAPKSSPVQIGTSSWSFLDLGGSGLSHGIDSVGRLFGWGYNTDGGIGDNTIIAKSSPVLVSGPAATSWIAVNSNLTTLAITASGSLYGWGQNNNTTIGGATGTFNTGNISSPVLVSGPAGVTWTSISVDGSNPDTAFGITTSGALYGWGSNSIQQAIPVVNNVSSPTQVGSSSWTAVSAGTAHTIGITATGVLYGWGLNTSGQLGINSLINNASPAIISSIGGSTAYSWTSLSMGGGHGALIRSDGTLWTWGLNVNGQVGNLTLINQSFPALVSGPAGVSWSAVSCGTIHTIGITTTGRLYAWGGGAGGALGVYLDTLDRSSPVLVSGPVATSWASVTAGASTSMAITTTGQLYAWGLGTSGQLGDLSIASKTSPVLVSGPAATSWSKVSTAYNASHAFAITTTGQLYGWGLNTSGQVGDFTITSKSSPVLVSGPAATSWSFITAGLTNGAGITTLGRLYTWGLGTSGQLGDLSIISKTSPVLVSGPATTSWAAVGIGFTNAVAITSTGVLYSWGAGTFGQLGDGTTTAKSSPVLVSGPTNVSWSSISTAGNSVGGLTNYLFYAWGYGNLANYTLPFGTSIGNTTVPTLVVTPLANNQSWSFISSGSNHTLALTTTGKLYAWGQGAFGQLGDVSAIAVRVIPVEIPTSISWSSIESGSSHSLAITTTGQLYGWGLNTSGQVGDGTTTTKSSPVLVSGPAATSWSVIAAGYSSSMGITTTGTLYAWGLNSSGQLGTGTYTNPTSPVLIANISRSWSTVSFGGIHSLGIKTDGTLWSWGSNVVGQLGINTLVPGSVISPVLVSGPASTSWAAIAAGASHSYGITTTGQLYAWGLGTTGQLGDLTIVSKSSPVLVSGPAATSWIAVTAGNFNGAAITSLGRLYSWGNGITLGDLTSISKSSPVLVSGPTTTSWSKVSSGTSTVIALTSLGRLYAWGLGTNGQLGDLTIASKTSPVLVSGPATTSWSFISAGGACSYAITTTGQLYAWGINNAGALGDLTVAVKSSPVLVSGPAATSWSSVSGGASFAVALTTTGLLYAWGLGTSGQLGDLSFTSKSSPVLVSGPTNVTWSSLPYGSAISSSTGAIDNTGAMYAWGLGTSGQLGTGGTGTANFSNPIVVVGSDNTTSWSAVSIGSVFALGITNSGLLYSWGDNAVGELGINSVTNYYPPYPSLVSGPATTSWSAIASGDFHALALTT